MMAARFSRGAARPWRSTTTVASTAAVSAMTRLASAGIRTLLQDAGVILHTSSFGVPASPGWLDLSPGHRRIRADRIVTEPLLAGPRLRGVPCGRDGFIHTDRHG